MKDEGEVEALLRKHRFTDEPVGAHLTEEALAARIERGEAFIEEERAHLASCVECRDIAGVLLRRRASEAQVIPLFGRRGMLAGLGIAASVAIAALLIAMPEDERRSKGARRDLTAEVSLLAIDRTGARRDLSSGQRVRTSDRLGFRYGNPKGAHRTLAILGWDGTRIHWYYPENENEDPPAIEGGAKALSVRMPFDVELSDHAPGKLVVMAAFDADPKRLAEKLQRGERDRDAFVFELVLEAEK